jgi:hypothetical protein
MKAVEAKYGISISLDGIKYMDKSFSVKLNAAVVSQDTQTFANIDPKWINDFERGYLSFGFKRDDINKLTAKIGGDEFVIVGLRPRAKLPVVAMNTKTKKFVVLATKFFLKG